MKTTIITIMKHFKKTRGNSLAEFATTTALMATLAATAAPKMSELTQIGKEEKTFENIDKVIKQASQFYQKTFDSEGRGRFPGQIKFNHSIGGASHSGYSNAGGSSTALSTALSNSQSHTDLIMDDLALDPNEDGWQNYSDVPENVWYSVFGCGDEYQFYLRAHECPSTNVLNGTFQSISEWLGLFGDEPLVSPFQDGHLVYTVVAGGGTGEEVYPPVIYVADVENAVDFNSVLEP